METKYTEKDTMRCLESKVKYRNYDGYVITDRTIYTAFVNDRIDFINCICQEKIIFPQIALLVSIVKMDISLCDMCLSYGCKIDEHCVTLACGTFNLEMIKYCIKKNVKPTKEDINLFFGEWTKDDIDLTNYTIILPDSKQFINYVFRYIFCHLNMHYSSTPPLFYNFVKYYNGQYEKLPLSNHQLKNIEIENKKKKAKCIDYLIEENLVSEEQVQKCFDNNIKINKNLLKKFNNIDQIEILCKKKCSNITEEREKGKNIKSLINKGRKFSMENSKHIFEDGTVQELIKIEEINKNKEIMEIFLDNIIKKLSISSNSDKTINDILEIKHDYNKNILDKLIKHFLIDKYINYSDDILPINIIKTLIMVYDIKLEKTIVLEISKKIDKITTSIILVNIEKISKNKELMEIFLENSLSPHLTSEILKIKNNYDKTLLTKIFNKTLSKQIQSTFGVNSFDTEIVKLLVEEYGMELSEENISNIMPPVMKYFVDKNKIKISMI